MKPQGGAEPIPQHVSPAVGILEAPRPRPTESGVRRDKPSPLQVNLDFAFSFRKRREQVQPCLFLLGNARENITFLQLLISLGLLKVSGYLVRPQESFVEKGHRELVPLP